ncbi:hypothetical protein ACJIZ3_004199 [Penstemon smallii]|uniref:Integral membrane bound transporter domain-containing protein n=1 Tax=Penstemon smallii TaxID=265156 RepID=A0ABD3S1D0_9LAMI
MIRIKSRTDHIMHPVHVAASTAIGVVACVLALLLPYPSLAYYQNASKRLNLFVKAFSAEEITLSKALISQANFLKITGAKLLQSIKSKQHALGDTSNQVPQIPQHKSRMEIALSNCSQIPHRLLNSEIKDDISILEEQLFNQIKNTTNENRVLAESNREKDSNFLQTHQISLTSKDLPSLFFIFCLKFQDVSARKQLNDSKKKNIFFTKKRLMPAIKCSISLGLAVLLGLLYSKENGYWSGLMVAISFAPSREATFRAANVKLQGTVLGTVYAVIFCFILKKYEKIRIISLLPWFVFCSFLCESRMYEKAGGMSAVISAVFILGRDNIGTPSEFGIARILLISLHSLHECVGSINLASFNRLRLEESLKKLKLHVNELGKLIEEAVIEGSLSKMTDILFYGSYALRCIEQELRKMGSSEIWEEAIVTLEIDVKLLRDVVCSRIKCFEEVSSVKSLEIVDRDLEKRKITLDQHEMRRYQMAYSLESNDEMEQNTSCFLQHLEELVTVGGGVEIEDGFLGFLHEWSIDRDQRD